MVIALMYIMIVLIVMFCGSSHYFIVNLMHKLLSLYSRQALLDGYLQHFFYTYHYFATCQQLLDFITSRFLVACRYVC